MSLSKLIRTATAAVVLASTALALTSLQGAAPAAAQQPKQVCPKGAHCIELDEDIDLTLTVENLETGQRVTTTARDKENVTLRVRERDRVRFCGWSDTDDGELYFLNALSGSAKEFGHRFVRAGQELCFTGRIERTDRNLSAVLDVDRAGRGDSTGLVIFRFP